MPRVITSKTKLLYERPPAGPFVLNRNTAFAQGLLAYWSLGESNINVYKDQANQSRVLTPNNTPLIGACPYGGLSPVFNGSNTNLEYASTAVLTTFPATFACHAVSTSDSTQQCLMVIEDGDTGDDWFLIECAGNVAGDPIRAQKYQSSQGAEVFAATTTGYTANVPFHACGVFYSAALVAAYINAGSRGTDTTNSTPAGITRTQLGAFRVSTSYFSPYAGTIFEAAIWNVAKSDADIYRMYDPKTRWEQRYRLGAVEYSFPQFAQAPPGPAGAFNAAWARANHQVGWGVH